MVECVCKIGIDLILILTDQNGRQRQHKVVWDEECFQNNLSDDWIRRLNDEDIPWVTSPAAKPHLADWIAFILDVPQTNRIKANERHVIGLKNIYSGSALSVLTQIAYLFDVEATRLTSTLDSQRFTKGRNWNSKFMWLNVFFNPAQRLTNNHYIITGHRLSDKSFPLFSKLWMNPTLIPIGMKRWASQRTWTTTALAVQLLQDGKDTWICLKFIKKL